MKNIFLLLAFILGTMTGFSQISEQKQDESKLKVDATRIIDNYLEPFYFDENSFVYCDQNYLEKLTVLLESSKYRITLQGHSTNAEFKEKPNLSYNRVKNIQYLLHLFGFNLEDIEIKDLKNTQPLEASGNDKINQRVEIAIMKNQ